jgi:hypothetical protein
VSAGVILIANLLVLLGSLAALAITVKLYTEILKDQRFEGRAKKHGHDGGRPLDREP